MACQHIEYVWLSAAHWKLLLLSDKRRESDLANDSISPVGREEQGLQTELVCIATVVPGTKQHRRTVLQIVHRVMDLISCIHTSSFTFVLSSTEQPSVSLHLSLSLRGLASYVVTNCGHFTLVDCSSAAYLWNIRLKYLTSDLVIIPIGIFCALKAVPFLIDRWHVIVNPKTWWSLLILQERLYLTAYVTSRTHRLLSRKHFLQWGHYHMPTLPVVNCISDLMWDSMTCTAPRRGLDLVCGPIYIFTCWP